MDQIYNLLDYFNQKHDEYNESFLTYLQSSDIAKINLRRKTIKDLYCPHNIIKHEYLNYIYSYLSFESFSIYDFEFNIDNKMNEIITKKNSPIIAFEKRIKNRQSIFYKITNKIKDKGGTYPIKDTLNDLIGYRIIVNNIDKKAKSIETYLNGDNRRKIINRNSKNYKAYHIYFYSSTNYGFPAEIQVWDKRFIDSNKHSHKKYKSQPQQDILTYNFFR